MSEKVAGPIREKLKSLLQESLAVATRTDAMKPSDLACVVIDTTVQPKAVMFPTDAKLLNRARGLVRAWLKSWA
jgi:IS5 family transposase